MTRIAPRRIAHYIIVSAVLAGTALASGCRSDRSAPDPSEAPRTNAPIFGADSIALSSQPQELEPVPDLTLTTLDGRQLALSEQKGKVLLINFWATWCPPCREEIPDLIALQDNLGPKGLMIIGVSLDTEGTEVVRSFVEDQGINYPVVVDADGSADDHFGPIYGLPTTLVVNPDGQIVRRIVGVFPVDAMRPELVSMLERTSEKGTPSSS